MSFYLCFDVKFLQTSKYQQPKQNKYNLRILRRDYKKSNTRTWADVSLADKILEVLNILSKEAKTQQIWLEESMKNFFFAIFFPSQWGKW